MFNHIAIVSQTNEVPNWELEIIAAALQVQVARDFTPIWGIDATVSAFDLLEDVPSGFWPMIIRDDIGFPGAAGIHLDNNKKPFGLVQASNRWPMTASHEILEILADPMGNRTRTAFSIKPEQGLVEFLVEVCDPSEAEQFGYQINGVWLSDFYTPDYFLATPAGSVRYSFTGAINEPRTILRGGYISWMDPATNHWWQQTWFGGNEPVFHDLGILDVSTESPRTVIDSLTIKNRTDATALVGLPKNDKIIVEQKALFKMANASNKKRASNWMNTIDEIIADCKL